MSGFSRSTVWVVLQGVFLPTSTGRLSGGNMDASSPASSQRMSSRNKPSKPGRVSSRQISENSSSLFEDVTYRQVDSEQREEFTQLLKKVLTLLFERVNAITLSTSTLIVCSWGLDGIDR